MSDKKGIMGARVLATATTEEQILNAYFASLDTGNTTKETYRRALKQWSSFLSLTGQTILGATRQTVLAYKKELQEQHKSAATVNAYLSAVRSLYSFTEAEGVKPNIAASVKGVKRAQNSPKEALTIEQAKRLLQAPEEGASLEQLRNYALVCLLTRRGLRTVEAARANIGDIRQISGQAVLYLRGKGYDGEQSDFIILNDTCLQPLYAYLEARGERDTAAPLFAGIGNKNHGGRLTTRTISRIAKAALASNGISSPTITAHSLRHTTATLAMLGGAQITDIAALLKHAELTSTAIYCHVPASERCAASAVARLLD